MIPDALKDVLVDAGLLEPNGHAQYRVSGKVDRVAGPEA
jgi:hypothetical protein